MGNEPKKPEDKPEIDPNVAYLAGMPTSKYLKKGFHSGVSSLKSSCERLSTACLILAICGVLLNSIIFIGSKATKGSMGLLPFNLASTLLMGASIVTGIGAIGGIIYVYMKHNEKLSDSLKNAIIGLVIIVLYIIIHHFIVKTS